MQRITAIQPPPLAAKSPEQAPPVGPRHWTDPAYFSWENHGLFPCLMGKLWEKTTGKLWKDPPFFLGKLTISMAMFNSYVEIPGWLISTIHHVDEDDETDEVSWKFQHGDESDKSQIDMDIISPCPAFTSQQVL